MRFFCFAFVPISCTFWDLKDRVPASLFSSSKMFVISNTNFSSIVVDFYITAVFWVLIYLWIWKLRQEKKRFHPWGSWDVVCSTHMSRYWRNVKWFPCLQREVGRTRDKRRKPPCEAEWFPAYRNENRVSRNENRVYIRSYKMVLWPIRARVLFELFYKMKFKPRDCIVNQAWSLNLLKWR